ncbi:MAG TPA: hypothetical protein DEA90_15705 [Opitutae bacterium]|nr:hypothetical protein [Opitutae bacterium]
MEAALHAAQFHGPIGIDALLFRDHSGQLQIKSVVEINPRFTMGRVALELESHNAPCSVGYFQIMTRSQLRKTGSRDFKQWAAQLTSTHPVQVSAGPQAQIRSGSFPLNDPTSAQQFLAVYHVRESIHDLLQEIGQ